MNMTERKVDRIINAIFHNNNSASSHAEIAALSGLPKRMIGPLLFYLRKHPLKFAYKIPHAPRGRGSFPGKFFTVPATGRDGGLDTDSVTPENMRALQFGAQGTVSYIASSSKHEAAAIEAYCALLPEDVLKRTLMSLTRDLVYIGEKAAELV